MARADFFVLLVLCAAVIALGSLSEATAFRRSDELTIRSANWPIKPKVLHHTKRATEEEHGHTTEEEHGHTSGELEEGSVQECLTECTLAHEFTELAEVLNFRVANSNETCVLDLEHCHHGNETEEHGHDEDHGAEEGSAESPCLETYHFFRALLRRLNLTSECCLVNGTHCGEQDMTGGGTGLTDPAKAYGYGFLMMVLVCAGSLLGIVVVPLVKKNTKFGQLYKYIYALMIALGASALFCDAILHLIPHAFNLHAHDEESSHNHAEAEAAPHAQVADYLWKGCVVILGMYGFFLLEVMLHIWNAHGHSHTHSHDEISSSSENSASDLANKQGKKKQKKKKCGGVHLDVTFPHGTCAEYDENTSTFIHPGGPAEEGVAMETSLGNNEHKSSESLVGKGEEEEEQSSETSDSEEDEKGRLKRGVHYCLNIKPLAWLIILGDGIHNLTDGLAIGAAISQSLSLGLSTAIAVVFHEIPHEFGDFAILLSTGMKWYVALIFNFVSSLTAILGFFVGVAVGSQSTEANNWVLAIAAGVFLYIALVDLLPDLIHSKEKGRTRWGLFIMANIGFYISFIVLLLIAIYEDQLNSLIS